MTELRRIHDVLAVLKPGHPNLNVSKIRYLEASGAISCTRQSDGTRWYSAAEIAAAIPTNDW